MNYNSVITVFRYIILNCSSGKSFQSKVYHTHTKQLEIGVSGCIYRIYSQESNFHEEIKDNRAKCFAEGGQWITKEFFTDFYFIESISMHRLRHNIRTKKGPLRASDLTCTTSERKVHSVPQILPVQLWALLCLHSYWEWLEPGVTSTLSVSLLV